MLSVFDEFLANPEQRDLTRALLASINASRGMFLAHGHAQAAAKLVETLATHFPDSRVHLLMAQRNPTRAVTVLGPGEVRTHEAPDSSIAQHVRSFLRQDPDVIAITQLDAEVGPIALQAAFTGHQVLLGSASGEVDGVIAALVGEEEHLREHAKGILGVIAELDLDGKLTSVRRGEHEVARVNEDGSTTLFREHLPAVESSGPLHTPHWAPAPGPPSGEARQAFLIRTTAEGPHLLGTRHALRPAGAEWPRCRECARPMHLVVQLALPLIAARTELAQLFLCGKGGCDLKDENAPGVRCELLSPDGLVTVHAPEELKSDVLEPGAMELIAFEDDRSSPLRCDKLLGWPNFEQGDDVPLEDDGTPMTLLFQFAEGSTMEGGRAPQWNFDEARQVPGEPPKKVIDPNKPRHFPSLLTGEAVAFLFLGRQRLAFRWQTG